MKKILALVLALMLVLGMTSALAVTISVTRHNSYDAEAGGDRDYTWYRVFKASYTSNTSTGGGVDKQGNVGAISTTASNASYTASSEVAAKLGSWDATGKTWTRATGNDWFNLKPIAGTTTYSVEWVGDSTAERAAAAAAWLLDKGAYEATGSLTWNGTTKKWTAEVDAGYYLLAGSEGANLVAATTDIQITEKDTYPPIDKKQKKENGTWVDDPLPEEIGKTIYYQVTIDVPADANKSIAVVDKMSVGLEWDTSYGTDGLSVSPATATYTTLPTNHARHDAANTWEILFSDDIVKAHAGQTITILYQATVTEDALIDTGRENEVTLDYNNGHYWIPDKVNYKTYFGGIYKVDPNDDVADLSGVKFALTSGGEAVNVTYVANGDYYVVDPTSTSNEVETRADNGYYTIKIRGLDGDKTYILTETENPHPGYNLLAEPVELTLIEDEGDAFSGKAPNTYDRVINNKGSLLPSTGGIGTTLFYIGGGILVLAAVILLVTKRRMNAND